MKRTLALSSAVAFGLLASVATSHAASTWDGGDTVNPTNWMAADNWAPNSLPDGGDNTTLDGGGTGVNAGVTVLGGAFTGGDVTVNNLTMRNGHVLTIDNSGFTLTVDGGSAINMGQGTPIGDGSTINLKAGTLSGTGTLTMSNNATQSATSFFNLSGTGILNYGNLNVGTYDQATFSVLGSSASATLSGDVNAFAQSIFSFDLLGAGGVSSIDAGGALNITTGALLEIDGSAYTGGANSFTLFNATSIVGSFDSADITITGLGAETTGWTLTQDLGGTGDIILTVVPEPSTFALLGGCLAFASVMLRRRR